MRCHALGAGRGEAKTAAVSDAPAYTKKVSNDAPRIATISGTRCSRALTNLKRTSSQKTKTAAAKIRFKLLDRAAAALWAGSSKRALKGHAPSRAQAKIIRAAQKIFQASIGAAPASTAGPNIGLAKNNLNRKVSSRVFRAPSARLAAYAFRRALVEANIQNRNSKNQERNLNTF